MQVHSLDIEDFGDDNYTLIGIHTSLEDFKLAYLLNNNLDTLFSKADYSLDFERSDSKASFSVYNFNRNKNLLNSRKEKSRLFYKNTRRTLSRNNISNSE